MKQSVRIWKLLDSNGVDVGTMLIVYSDGSIGVMCNDDYYNGVLSIEESEKLALAVFTQTQ